MNVELFRLINNFAGKNQIVDWFFIFGAKYLIWIILAIVIFLFFPKKLKLASIASLLTGLISISLNYLIFYNLFPQGRPYQILGNVNKLIEHLSDKSFPSNHAAFAFALALPIFYYNKKIGTVLLVLALLVGFSRVYVGVHFPFDIIGGFFVALIVSLLVNFYFKKYLKSVKY